MTNPTLFFRYTVFFLALGYWVYQFFATDPGHFGLQFRFLTVWTLTANLIVAGQMLRLSLGHTQNQIPHFVSLVVVMNVSVVVNYWRLYLADPENFYRDGDTIAWFQEYYLHVLGPLLMWIDAFFLLGVFRKFRPVAIYALILGLAYPLWIELVIAPLNDAPAGKVATGLPYAFLNDMEFSGRVIFYTAITVFNMVFICFGWAIVRFFRQKAE